MGTFGELGKKLTKKLGKYEDDLQSTEPDIRTTAELMVPRLKASMEKLIQGQELFKAQRVQGDLNKSKSSADMEKTHGAFI